MSQAVAVVRGMLLVLYEVELIRVPEGSEKKDTKEM